MAEYKPAGLLAMTVMAPQPVDAPAHTRRSVLAGTIGATVASGGCLKRLRTVVGRSSTRQVSLSIKVRPTDSDPYGVPVAQHLARNLREAGMDVQVVPLPPEELRRQILVGHDFDLYIDRFPTGQQIRPDELYTLLHSNYIAEPGWQNPFGYTNVRMDDQLEAQRMATGAHREEVVRDALTTFARTVPMLPLVLPDDLAVVRTDRFEGWNRFSVRTPQWILGLTARTGAEADQLRFGTADPRLTTNRNPLAVEFRGTDPFLDLVYEPIARPVGESITPWLAMDWSWTESGDGLTAVVRLKEGLKWHDGARLTAADIAFTYRFMADTSLGGLQGGVPAPVYRGPVSLVTDVTALGDREAAIGIGTPNRSVAERALTVPVLPEHVWADRSGPATVAGIEVSGETTEALIWTNPNPIGSGPLRFRRSSPGESVVFERFDDHFLMAGTDPPSPALAGGPPAQHVRVKVVASDNMAVALATDDEIDATVSTLGPGIAPRVSRSPTVRLVGERSGQLYHVGFNARRPPVGNPRFRWALGRLVDRPFLAREIFDEYAVPVVGPLDYTPWAPPRQDEAPAFAGTAGELDVERAREAFTDAGYQYSEDGNLLMRSPR